MHGAENLTRRGLARGVGHGEGALAPRDGEGDVDDGDGELPDRARAPQERLRRHLGVHVRRRALVKLRHDKLGAERLRERGERRGRRRAELSVRDLLRQSLHRHGAVAFGKLGRLGREDAENLKRLREHLENFIVEAGKDGERADRIARRGAHFLRRHRVNRGGHRAHTLHSLLPVAGLELGHRIGRVRRGHSLDEFLLGRGRRVGDVGVSLG